VVTIHIHAGLRGGFPLTSVDPFTMGALVICVLRTRKHIIMIWKYRFHSQVFSLTLGQIFCHILCIPLVFLFGNIKDNNKNPMDWLKEIQAKRKKLPIAPKKKKKPVISFDGDGDDMGPDPTSQSPPKSTKQQAYLNMMEKIQGIADRAEEDYQYDPITEQFKPKHADIEDDVGVHMDEMVKQTEALEGTEGGHDLFGEGFGIEMKKKNRCGQYKTSKFSCEEAGCKYSEGSTKTGKKTSYCRSPPQPKKKKVSPKPPASPKPPRKVTAMKGTSFKSPKKGGKGSPTKTPPRPPKTASPARTPKTASRCTQYKTNKDVCVSQGCIPASTKTGSFTCRNPPTRSPKSSPKQAKAHSTAFAHSMPQRPPVANYVMPISSAPKGMPSAMAQPLPGAYVMQTLPTAPAAPMLRRR
jgi:hypothetical protein